MEITLDFAKAKLIDHELKLKDNPSREKSFYSRHLNPDLLLGSIMREEIYKEFCGQLAKMKATYGLNFYANQ